MGYLTYGSLQSAALDHGGVKGYDYSPQGAIERAYLEPMR